MRPSSLATLSGLLLIAVAASTLAWSQSGTRLSAREIFYSAPGEPAPARKDAVPKAASAPKKAAPAAAAKAKPAAPPAGAGAPAPLREGAELAQASYSPPATYPLGLRYSILKRVGAESVEVSSEEVFRAGDRIRLRIETNGDGYLYIIHQGSSGIWKPLFPSAEIAEGDNRVERGRQYEIPQGYVFTFDEQPGDEKLFIVLTRQPEPDLEGLIYSLRGPARPGEPAGRPEGKILLAHNLVSINDGVVSRLRNVYARDLIIEKADETSPPAASAPPREKAVYVVNPARSADARVVADVTLSHK